MKHSGGEQPVRFKNIKKLFKISIGVGIISVLVGTVTALNSVFELVDHIEEWMEKSESKISIEFNAATSVKGEIIPLLYVLPKEGYYSIWNKNRSGMILRVEPPNNVNRLSSANPENHQGRMNLESDTAQAEETVILLWSERSQHPPSVKYESLSAFDRYLQQTEYDFKRASTSIQIK